MLEMRPNCEICDKDLKANEPGALICSMECTFCGDCNHNTLMGRCPNCGGALAPRPTREGKTLKKHPASKDRVLKKNEA